MKKALDMKAAVLELFITVRGRPILTSYDICFPPLPFKLTAGTNLGYQVSDLISKGKRSCSDGKEQSSKPLVVYDNGVKPAKIAMAIVETPNRGSDGKWQIKNSKGIWKEVRMESKKKGELVFDRLICVTLVEYVVLLLPKLTSPINDLFSHCRTNSLRPCRPRLQNPLATKEQCDNLGHHLRTEEHLGEIPRGNDYSKHSVRSLQHLQRISPIQQKTSANLIAKKRL